MELATTDWPIFVINLERSQDRLKSVQRQMASEQLSFHRVIAIDALELTDRYVANHERQSEEPRFKRKLSRPEIACYLSHKKVWQQICESPSEAAFVFEDDVELAPRSGHVLRAISGGVPDWDILRLYASRPGRLQRTRPIAEGYVSGIAGKPPAMTVGYALTKAAARHLLDTSPVIEKPIDMDLKFWWRNGLCTRTVSPSICAPSNSANYYSDIERGRLEQRPRNKTVRFLANLRYQLVYNFLVLFHRRDQPMERRFY